MRFPIQHAIRSCTLAGILAASPLQAPADTQEDSITKSVHVVPIYGLTHHPEYAGLSATLIDYSIDGKHIASTFLIGEAQSNLPENYEMENSPFRIIGHDGPDPNLFPEKVESEGNVPQEVKDTFGTPADLKRVIKRDIL